MPRLTRSRLEDHDLPLVLDASVLINLLATGMIDDVLATGGTASASCELVEKLGAEIAACAFVIELDALQGRNKLGDRRIHSLLHY